MSGKELNRVGVMARVKSRELKLGDAAQLLGVSYRQVKRIQRRYREQGPAGLKHGNAGKRSHRARPSEERREILQLVREHYGGEAGRRFGPTLAAEHVEREHGRKVDAETLRRWMLSEGLWSRMRKRQPMRRRRERKAHFGELVQMDGSPHAWLEERGPRGCLMDMVDDATSIGEIRLEKQETIWAAVGVLRRWIERHGVPLALYVDRKNMYVGGGKAEERARGRQPMPQFGRMCQQLGIRIIAAHSPQAKGRVERAHGTHQDRLVKELRLHNISTQEAANRYIEHEYLLRHNQSYSRPAAQAEDYHRPAPSGEQLRQIFRLEYQRSLSNDWVVRHGGRLFQVQRQREHYAPARSKVTVCAWEDGTLEIQYRGQAMSWKEITAAVRANRERPKEKANRFPVARKPVKNTPVAEHPWRRPGRKEEAVKAQERAYRRWRNDSLATVPSSASP